MHCRCFVEEDIVYKFVRPYVCSSVGFELLHFLPRMFIFSTMIAYGM